MSQVRLRIVILRIPTPAPSSTPRGLAAATRLYDRHHLRANAGPRGCRLTFPLTHTCADRFAVVTLSYGSGTPSVRRVCYLCLVRVPRLVRGTSIWPLAGENFPDSSAVEQAAVKYP